MPSTPAGAVKVQVHVSADHLVRLPSEIPEGPAELIVISSAATSPGDARRAALGRYDDAGLVVPDDFDAALPSETQALFEGDSTNTR